MNEKEFNTMFDETFEKVVSEIDIDTVPDYTTAWGKTRIQMKNQRVRKNRFKKMQIASGIAGMIIIGSIVFSLPVVSDALDPVMSRIAQTRDQIVDVFRKDDETFEDGMKTAPPPDDAGDVIYDSESDETSIRFDNNSKETKWSNLEEYKTNIPNFPLKDMKYIPKNYTFLDAVTFSSNGNTFNARFKFVSNQGDILSLKAILNTESIDQVVSFDTESYIYEKITLQNGTIANIYLFDNGDIKVYVSADQLLLHMYGNISKEEAIEYMEGLLIE